MSKTQKKDAFIPFAVSDIDYANGIRLRISQVNARGACRVEDACDNYRPMNYTHSKEAAWASVRYLGGITDSSNRSRGADDYKLRIKDLIPPPRECPSVI